MPKPSLKPVLLDNTILTNFTLVSQASQILSLWTLSCTTVEVMNEYQKGIQIHNLSSTEWQTLPIIHLTDTKQAFAQTLSSSLGKGESSCIAVAYHRQGLFVSDDNVARKQAKALSIPISGTLGALVALIQQKKISLTQGNSWLQQMIDAGYRSPITQLNELV